MAGMLAGVECARRRRFHQSGGSSDSVLGFTRRPSFCLYTSNHESLHSSVFSQRRVLIEGYEDDDEKLGEVAREAKERLDERLRSQRKSEPKRQNSKETMNHMHGKCLIQGELHREVFGSKRRLGWVNLSRKALEHDECLICLERFKAGETLVRPPCAHRFHSRCLVPWLENNGHCPCCRLGILSLT
ncbi:hypothetical protein ES319_D13G238000v1 [Gossypium barbadense]|uniref:RING-type E3 ubiquitin transferase n=4 Tax=Gossypium TaxID=3633 RepID=A0A5J5NQJ3_GOSBA|nr:hypothetical protein ES319_D13G238000v1 [Gossypium barbadense]PPD74107.1 hypothetical protein GOBAR_DD28962 [Gossypium barbadense]TYG38777.1 hypothetical protein ES288_D13G251400v1 [Gossypium darwinii]TYH36275.1 hypothetical protein ES332_D13G253600v1 [Gossypium tomentosum]